jgi:uncharacterized protein (TIGR02646 family)
MKHIAKEGAGTQKLQQAHANPPQTAKQAASRWHNLQDKQTLLTSHLLHEQYGLCGYSEVDAEDLALGFHIEHIENKSQTPGRTFDYQNLIASAFSSTEGLPSAKVQNWELFGGHASGKQGHPHPVDMTRLVSPLLPGCARFFAYLSDGTVVPQLSLSAQDSHRASYTINILNLNSPYLVSLRKEWWEDLDALYEEHLPKGWSLEHLASVDLLPRNQRLSPFFTLTRQFFGRVAERLLQQQAPQLV